MVFTNRIKYNVNHGYYLLIAMTDSQLSLYLFNFMRNPYLGSKELTTTVDKL